MNGSKIMIDELMSEDFLQQVHDCLANYYEYSFLRTLPLVKALTPRSAGEALHIQDFRRTVDELLGRLRREDDSALSSKYARLHKILYMRYIDQLSIQQILYNLDISERQYYRDHAKALETFSHILRSQNLGRFKLLPSPSSRKFGESTTRAIQPNSKI